MQKENDLLKEINDLFQTISKESYGENIRGANGKMLPPSAHHYLIYIRKLYELVYELYHIVDNKYITIHDLQDLHKVCNEESDRLVIKEDYARKRNATSNRKQEFIDEMENITSKIRLLISPILDYDKR